MSKYSFEFKLQVVQDYRSGVGALGLQWRGIINTRVGTVLTIHFYHFFIFNNQKPISKLLKPNNESD